MTVDTQDTVLGEGTQGRTIVAAWMNAVKLPIVGLVIVSTLTGIYLGSNGSPDPTLVLWTLTAISFATAASALFNNYYDRDIDAIMDRTSRRAVASGEVNPKFVLYAAVISLLVSIGIMDTFVKPVAMYLTWLAVFGYAFLYTMVLKRHTPWANQIGGLAGALPPAIGYTAATGAFSAEVAILFAIAAVWQQPHALSLALKYREDYAKANVPVIPVAKGIKATKVRIFLYSLLLIPVGILPYNFGMAGKVYAGVALILGLLFAALSLRFLLSDKKMDAGLFVFSIIYLTFLFTAMVLDIIIY